MSNMSYCRFRNTAQDLQDCFCATEEIINDREVRKEFYLYSREEYRSLVEMADMAREFAEYAEQALDMIEDEKNEYQD